MILRHRMPDRTVPDPSCSGCALTRRPARRSRSIRESIGRHESAVQAQRTQTFVRELGERLQVYDVFHVVFEEEIQRVVIARVECAPEPGRVESSEARRLLTAQNPDLGLDCLEAADESEAPERMNEVEVNLVQMHPRERLAGEPHIEARAMEVYEERRVFQGRTR